MDSSIASSIGTAVFRQRMHDEGYDVGQKCCLFASFATLASITRFVMGCIGASGGIAGTSLGWITIGLSTFSFGCDLALGQVKKRKIVLIGRALTTLSFLVLGILGGIGILSETQVGWGIIGTVLATPLSLSIQKQIKKRQNPPPPRTITA